MQIAQFLQAAAHEFSDADVELFRQGLPQLADGHVRMPQNVTRIGLQLAGDEFEQRRLAGAVTPDHADTLTGVQLELRVAQDRHIAEFKRDVVEAHQ